MPNEDYKSLEEFKEENLEENELSRMYLERRGGRCVMHIEVADEIEEFFSSEDKGQSQEWHSSDEEDQYHEFYYKNYSEEVKKHLQMKNDSFGGDYVNDGHVNIGLLRTVGLSDGLVEFELPAQYSEDTLLDSVRELKEEIEILYRQFIRPVTIHSSLTIAQT